MNAGIFVCILSTYKSAQYMAESHEIFVQLMKKWNVIFSPLG